jgi:hypothetical protein
MNKKIILAVLPVILFVSTSAGAQKTQLLSVSKQIVTALKNKDMKTVAAHAHPTKGVRFAPYSYLSESDLTFKKAQIPSLFLTRRSYKWGEFDGTGDPINLGFPAYYKRFIYDRNFANARQVSYNRRKGGAGNAVFNAAEVYPDGKYVEYYLPGTDRYEFRDWRSLILVFEKSGARWFLVAVAHDEWTI